MDIFYVYHGDILELHLDSEITIWILECFEAFVFIPGFTSDSRISSSEYAHIPGLRRTDIVENNGRYIYIHF